MPDITSANAVFIISVPLLLPTPQQLQGFGVDDMFDADDVDTVETMMGVDGVFAGGFRYVERPMTISLLASSESNTFFDSWNAMQTTGVLAAPAVGNITLPSLGVTYALVQGYLTRYKPLADAKRVLQTRRFQVKWGRIIGTPVGLAG
jgi:hypothetical protein